MNDGKTTRGTEERADLLAFLGRRARSNRQIRRVERWRRRGRSGRWVAREAESVAETLAGRGIGAGDRVALYLNDGPLWHAAFFGTLRAGAVAVPLDVGLEPEVLSRVAGGLDLAAWCTEREVPRLELDLPRVDLDWRRASSPPAAPPPWPPDDPDRVAEIVLTSGTGGAPKAVPVTHANLRAVLDGLEAGIEEYRWALGLAPPLRLAAALPLSHLYGQVMGVFLPPLLKAHVAMVAPMPAPDLARALKDERAWALATVPRTLALLGRHLESEAGSIWGPEGTRRKLEESRSWSWWRRPLGFARLRGRLGHRLVAVVSGGAALDREVEELWRALGYVVVQGYGLTETAPLVTLNHPFDTATGSLGRPLPGVEVRIADDGEILVRGPNVVTARLEGSAVDERGWLHTGDLGRLDETGRLAYLGRKGERIVTPAGVNVDPGPVADRLLREPGIHDAIVLERPWGERGVVCAVLAVAPGADPGAAIRTANENLPDAARVRSWHVWPEPDFPRTRTGKARRPAILAWLEERAPESFGNEDAAGEPAPAESPQTPADAFTALARTVARIAGVDPGDLDRSTPVGDLLGSLDRVELVTRLEATYGVPMGPEAFAGDVGLGALADELFAAAESGQSGAERTTAAPPAEPTAGPVGEAAATPRTDAQEAEGDTVQALDGVPTVGPETGPPRGLGRGLERVPEARWRHRALVRATRRAFRTGFLRPFWRSFFAMDVGGLDHLTGIDPPYIVAANHLSDLDPGAVLFALPERPSSRIATTAMWEYFPRAWTGPLLYALGVWGLDMVPLVQVGDWRPTLRIAGSIADRGGSILVYPEGERSMDGELLPFRNGVGVMAQELHLPIVPCGAAGLLAVFPKGRHWIRGCWFGRAPVAVRFGRPLSAPGPDDEPEAVVTELRRRIEPLVEEARHATGRY